MGGHTAIGSEKSQDNILPISGAAAPMSSTCTLAPQEYRWAVARRWSQQRLRRDPPNRRLLHVRAVDLVLPRTPAAIAAWQGPQPPQL